MSTKATGEQVTELTVSPQEYGEFIAQVELISIWLVRTQVRNLVGPMPPPQGTFAIGDKAHWESGVDGFTIFQRFNVELKTETGPAMEMTVEFGLAYQSQAPMTDQIFCVFERVNLPVNIWPYLREYLADMLGRMGWMPYTLPVYKVNTPTPSAGKATSETAKKRRSAKRSNAGAAS